MGNIYKQWTAVVNIVFTIAAVILIVTKFTDTGMLGRTVMVVMVLLFPVIQPLAVLIMSVRQAGTIKVDTTLSISDRGFGIQVLDHRQLIQWKDFKAVIKRPGMLVMMPDEKHAYLIPDRVTRESKEALYQAVLERIRK